MCHTEKSAIYFKKLCVNSIYAKISIQLPMITAVDYFNYHFQRNKCIAVLYLKWPFCFV